MKLSDRATGILVFPNDFTGFKKPQFLPQRECSSEENISVNHFFQPGLAVDIDLQFLAPYTVFHEEVLDVQVPAFCHPDGRYPIPESGALRIFQLSQASAPGAVAV